MTVKQLKGLLKDVDDEIEVLIPVNAQFDGMFRSPCTHETGVSQIADIPTTIDEYGLVEMHDEEDELLAPQIDVFLILPHGFSDQSEDEVNSELN
jgi:hypothetical protein